MELKDDLSKSEGKVQLSQHAVEASELFKAWIISANGSLESGAVAHLFEVPNKNALQIDFRRKSDTSAIAYAQVSDKGLLLKTSSGSVSNKLNELDEFTKRTEERLTMRL